MYCTCMCASSNLSKLAYCIANCTKDYHMAAASHTFLRACTRAFHTFHYEYCTIRMHESYVNMYANMGSVSGLLIVFQVCFSLSQSTVDVTVIVYHCSVY